MKVHLYTLTYNEEKILPFFFQHYESFVTKFIIYDNESTDSTVKICKARKDTEIREWNSKRKMNSFTLSELRNKIWKDSIGKCDFIIVCDADEFLYTSKSNINEVLELLKKNKFSVVKPIGFGMVSKDFPKFSSKKPITKQIRTGVRAPLMDKCVLFSPKYITEMNFSLGSHYCMPEGRVKIYRDDFELLHYKALGVEYSLERKNLFKKRVPKKNLRMGISKHYFTDDKVFVKAIKTAIRKAERVI